MQQHILDLFGIHASVMKCTKFFHCLMDHYLNKLTRIFICEVLLAVIEACFR